MTLEVEICAGSKDVTGLEIGVGVGEGEVGKIN